MWRLFFVCCINLIKFRFINFDFRVNGSKYEESYLKSSSDIPIYDYIRTPNKPHNFGLSKHGHLQIDYSCSWINLDKYIYN